MSLTYRAEDRTGKTEGATDTYSGEFTKLVPDEQVVERIEFETDDPDLQGAMTMTWTLREVEGGTEVDLLHEGAPGRRTARGQRHRHPDVAHQAGGVRRGRLDGAD